MSGCGANGSADQLERMGGGDNSSWRRDVAEAETIKEVAGWVPKTLLVMVVLMIFEYLPSCWLCCFLFSQIHKSPVQIGSYS